MLSAHAVRGQLAEARRLGPIFFEVIPAKAVERHENEGRVRPPNRRHEQQEQTEQDATQGHATSVQFSRPAASGPWRGAVLFWRGECDRYVRRHAEIDSGQRGAGEHRAARRHSRPGLGADPPRRQDLLVPRAQRRLVPEEPAGDRRRRAAQLRRHPASQHRRLCRHPREARGLAGPGAEMGGESRGGRRHRRGRCHLPASEKGPYARVPARDRPPASALEPVRLRLPRAQPAGLCHPPVFPGTRLRLRAHADRHRQRLRGRGRTVPGDHARPAEPAQARGRRDRLREGFLRTPDLPDGQRPARGRGLCLRVVQGLHVRADLPRRELEHLAPRQRILDDRAGDGVLRPAGQHGSGRGVREAPDSRRAHALRRGPRAVRQVRGQGAAAAPRLRARPAVPARQLHRGGRAADQERAPVRVPGRVRHQSPVGARALPDGAALQVSGDGLQLPEGDQTLLHAAQ